MKGGSSSAVQTAERYLCVRLTITRINVLPQWSTFVDKFFLMTLEVCLGNLHRVYPYDQPWTENLTRRKKKKKKKLNTTRVDGESDIATLAVLFALFVANFSHPALFWVSVFTFFHPKPPLRYCAFDILSPFLSSLSLSPFFFKSA